MSAVDFDDDCVSGDCDDVYSSEDLYLALIFFSCLIFFHRFFTRVDACIVVILSCVEFEEKRCFLHAF